MLVTLWVGVIESVRPNVCTNQSTTGKLKHGIDRGYGDRHVVDFGMLCFLGSGCCLTAVIMMATDTWLIWVCYVSWAPGVV